MKPARVCPDDILALFRDEATKEEGRLRAVKWMESIMPDLCDGDEVLIPNPVTGKLLSFTKNGRQLQS